MSFIEPKSHIKIYRGIESSGKRRPIFATKAAQSAYFQRHLAFDYTPTTHIKYTHTRVRVTLSIGQLLGCNYLSFVNPSFGNKVYYANIVGDPVYINNETTELTYAVDYAQTDMFDVTIEDSYIDREHLSEEDYQKTVDNAYDSTVAEMYTAEPLVSDKDLEDYYAVKETVSNVKWAGKANKDDMVDILAFSPIKSPNNTESEWLYEFLNALMTNGPYDDDNCDDIGYLWGHNLYTMFDASTISLHHGEDLMTYMMSNVTSVGNKTLGLNVSGEYMMQWMKLQSRFSKPYSIIAIGRDHKVNGQTRNNPVAIEEFIERVKSWSGTSELVIALHSVPAYMFFEMFDPDEQGHIFYTVDVPDGTGIHNKKLLRYPYSYIRAVSPCGDIKEYQFEKSDDVNGEMLIGQTPEFKFDLYFDYNATATYSLIPVNYKMEFPNSTVLITGVDWDNMFERLDYNCIPQVPYICDAWITALAATNAEILKSNTVETQNQMIHAKMQLEFDQDTYSLMQSQNNLAGLNDMLSIGQNGLNAVQGMAGSGSESLTYDASGNVTGGYGQTTEGMSAGKATFATLGIMGQALQTGVNAEQRNLAERRMHENMAYNNAQRSLRQNMLDDSAKLSLSNLEENAVYHNFKDTKPAYCCDHYYAQVGTGSYFFNKLMVLDFLVYVVKLRPDIIAKYDAWFSNYGYNSGRFGIPHIMAYLTNAESGKPHFAPSGSMNVTYIKTSGAAVKAPSKTSETFWEAMLDGGIQFIKGEDLD